MFKVVKSIYVLFEYINLERNMHMSEANHKNIVVVGAGIIGTSVATMLSKVSPNWHIDMFERLEGAGIELSLIHI